MNEFAKMIYEQWLHSQDGEEFNWGEYDEVWKKFYDILNEQVATDIECSVNKKYGKFKKKHLWQDLAMLASAFQMARLS